MMHALNSDLVSKLEIPEIEINFYFSAKLPEIIKRLEQDNSPLRFKYNQDEMGIYQVKGYADDEFCLMDNKEDWLYDDNELKNHMIKDCQIVPNSLLFYQTRLLRNSARLTKSISDYLVDDGLEFFLLSYSTTDEDPDIPIFANKPYEIISI